MITLTINDKTVEVPVGYTILQAAESVGITIPTLCYHKDLSHFGGCRLCVIEVQGSRLPMTSCNLPVNPGMIVKTDTETLTRFRKTVLQMLISKFYDSGYKNYDGKFDLDQDSELAYWARTYDIDIRSNMSKKPEFPIDSDPNPFIWVDMNKCIQCTRCVRACAEVQGRFVWTQAYRGYKSRIVAGSDSTLLQSRCESCGACVVYCPTGVLDNKKSVSAGRADRFVRTTCTYCGVGCQFDLNVKDDVPGGRILRVTSNQDRSVSSFNGLHLCVKGRYGYEFIHDVRRQTKPRVREYILNNTTRPKERGKWVEVDWDIALEAAAKGLQKAKIEFGGPSVGILASGKNLNEENYLLCKLARQVLDTNNIDSSSWIYYSSVVDGMTDALGFSAMSNTFEDIADHAQALFVIGSNLTEQHPVFGARLRQVILRRKIKMVVANPDFLNIDEYSSLALYHRPNTEAALLNGLMNIILDKGWENRSFIEKYPTGFEQFKSVIASYPPGKVSEITGLPVASLYQAAEILALNHPMAVLWSLGLADPATGKRNVQSLINLQLLLGNLDLPGGGVNPLHSQNNLQGASDMGCLPDMLPGYQAIADDNVRQNFEQAWGSRIPSHPGLTAQNMITSAREGNLSALYILGEDILNSSPKATYVRKALTSCNFIVLQEVLSSDTTRYADVLLPGVSFAEKTGTFTSAERRIQMVNQAIQPIGDAKPDWQIIAQLAQHILNIDEIQLNRGAYSGWDYESTDEIMQEISSLAPIYGGISHSRLHRGEILHWPVYTSEHPGSPLLPLGLFSKGQVQWTSSE